MHLTLWQQFSSNHSAMYTVVGVFPTPAAAQDAYTKLREIIQSIADDKGGSQNELFMTAAEIRIAEQYKIDWQERLDWLLAMRAEPRHYRNPPYTVDDAVNIVDNLVIVDAPGASFTWQTGHQFVALIRTMNGMPFQSMYNGEEPVYFSDILYLELIIEITCAAPKLETAVAISTLITNYFQKDGYQDEKLPMPWAGYHPYLNQIAPDLTPERYAIAEQDWLKGEEDFKRKIWKLRLDTALGGTCEVNGNTIKLKIRATPSYTSMSLISLISWLKAQGCSDFQYEFQQRSG